MGSWNKKCEIEFIDNLASSSINLNSKGNKISVDTLDNLFINTPITFIKMDIEGSEKETLMGAEKLIKKYKPKLAVCVYHKWEDIYEIPQIIKSLVPEYKIHLRHHSASIEETVYYACI